MAIETADVGADTDISDDDGVTTTELPANYVDALKDIDGAGSAEQVADENADTSKPKHKETESDTTAGESDEAAGEDVGEEEEDTAGESEKPASEEAESESLSWPQERSYAKDLGINTKGMKRPEVQAAILSHNHRLSQEDSQLATLREQAVGHGVEPSDVAGIENTDELRRLVGVLDRRKIAAAESVGGESDDELIRPSSNGKPKPGEGQQAAGEGEAASIDWQALEDEFEHAPKALGIVRSIHEANVKANERLDQMEQHFASQQEREDNAYTKRIVKSFDDVVGGLGHDDLFGKEKPAEGSKENGNREKLWGTWTKLRDDGAEPDAAMVGRALNATFPQELKEKDDRVRAEKVRKHGRKISGGGGGRKVSKQPFDGDLEDNTTLHQYFHALLESQG